MTKNNLLDRRRKVLGPAYALFYEKPRHMVRGEGVWMWDREGRKYLDCYNNVPSVGHCHPHVVQAISEQAATLNTNTRYLHETVLELGEMLLDKLPPHLDTIMFTCTGSEANDLALQIARAATGRQGMLVTEASYFGNTALTRQISPDYDSAEVPPDWLCTIEPPNLYRGPYLRDDPEAGQKYLAQAKVQLDELEARGQHLAAMAIDTTWDNNGPLTAPPDLPATLCDEVRRRGGLVLCDEVQAGYCRTGSNWWGFNNYGLVPDMVTMGKPMGDGHPLAALATRRDLVEPFARFGYFNTFGGNPVSASAGKAVIEVIDREGLLEKVATTGAYLEEGLRELAEKHEVVGAVDGRGLFWGLDLVTDRAAKTPVSRADMKKLGNLIADEGVLTGTSGRYGQILKLRPPLVFGREEVDVAIPAIDRALTRFAELLTV